MREVGMRLEALPDPMAEIAEAPDRADVVAAPIVLDDAFADALDIGRIVVEVADQRPDGRQGMVEYGAVKGCRHDLMMSVDGHPDHDAPARRNPPDFRSTTAVDATVIPSPPRHGRCKPSHEPAEIRHHGYQH